MSTFLQKDIDRLWRKVDKERSKVFYNGTRCWEWTIGCDTSGYGQISINGKMLLVHRVSYELAYNGIPTGLHILHYCDNRKCANPTHLWAGTNKDNVDDMNRKGRHANFRGESNPSCKLTDEQVSEIRRRYKPFGLGVDNISSLSKEFGVSRRQIRRLLLYISRA